MHFHHFLTSPVSTPNALCSCLLLVSDTKQLSVFVAFISLQNLGKDCQLCYCPLALSRIRICNFTPNRILRMSNQLPVLPVLTSLIFLLTLPISLEGSSRSFLGHSKQVDEVFRQVQAQLPNITFPNVSNSCKAAIETVFETSALNAYLDATGKPQSGIFLGNVGWLGSYSECTKIIPAAHYCLAHVLINQTLPINWGVCVPQECSEDDVTNGLGDAFAVLHNTIVRLNYNAKVTFGGKGDSKPVHCAKKSEYTTGVIITLILCGLILLLVFSGTIFDISSSFFSKPCPNMNKSDGFMPITNQSVATDNNSLPYFANNMHGSQVEDGKTQSVPYQVTTRSISNGDEPNIVARFFLCFSLLKNTRRIMDTTVPPGAITSINGMRVLSMWWVVLGHTYGFQTIASVSNIGLIQRVLQRFTFQTVDNATFSVDSFFFLSGLLVAYLSLRQMEKADGKLPLFKFYFHRFWRLTPTYMFVLLFYDKLTGFLGEGPMWYTMQTNAPCDKYWWTNLLYINNFYPTSFGDSCMDWSWYLANDMQFFIICPVVLFAAYRFHLPGLLATTGVLLSASFITSGVIIYHFNLEVIMFSDLNRTAEYMSKVYVKPYCRIAPYLVGMLLGYVFHVKKRRIPMVYLFNVIGWCVAIVLALSTLYGEYKVLRKHNPEPFNTAENITYGTFSRLAWSLALAWVIFACHRGLGGLVDKILSARFWIPLSRLTYSVYLVHIIVIDMFFASLENNWGFSDVHSSFCFAGVVTLSYAAAFIICVCVEFPMMQLEKLIFKTNR